MTGTISFIMHEALMLYTLRASRRLPATVTSMKKLPVLLIQALAVTMLATSPVHAAHAAHAAHPSSSKKKPITKSRSVKAKPGQKARSKSKAASPVPEFANFTQWQAVDGFIDEMCRDHGFERDALISYLGRFTISIV